MLSCPELRKVKQVEDFMCTSRKCPVTLYYKLSYLGAENQTSQELISPPENEPHSYSIIFSREVHFKMTKHTARLFLRTATFTGPSIFYPDNNIQVWIFAVYLDGSNFARVLKFSFVVSSDKRLITLGLRDKVQQNG